MRNIVNKIRLCVRKYVMYLETSERKKRDGKEGIYARKGWGGGGGGGGGGWGARRKGFLARALVSYLAHSWP